MNVTYVDASIPFDKNTSWSSFFSAPKVSMCHAANTFVSIIN